MDLLDRNSWPGNIRQLENTLQRLTLLAGDGPITTAVVESDRDLRRLLLGEPETTAAMATAAVDFRRWEGAAEERSGSQKTCL